MLKIGVFGVGHLGKIHVSQWQQLKKVELVGFFDPSDVNAEKASKQFGIERYTEAEELMEKVDAVDIVASTTYHYELCELAIRKGKHVFVEKPMVHFLKEGQKILKLLEESDIKFQVGHVERFNPAFLALKGWDLNPMFIEVHRLAEFNPRGTDVSVVLDLMIHDIDIVLSVVQANVSRVSASGVAVMSETPDICNARLEFHNGCVANLTASRISLKKMRKARLFQKDAYIGIDFLHKKTEVIKMKGEKDEGLFTLDIDTASGKKTIAIASPEIKETNAIRMELELFRDAVIEDQPVEVSAHDAYRALEVAHQILGKMDFKID